MKSNILSFCIFYHCLLLEHVNSAAVLYIYLCLIYILLICYAFRLPHDLQTTIPVAKKIKIKINTSCCITPVFSRLSEEVRSMWKWMYWLMGILVLLPCPFTNNPVNRRKTEFLSWVFNAFHCLHVLSGTWLTSFTTALTLD